ncbi:hypothetical protein TcWFU_003732 [Taenia crassiceps]|uniref:Uncharacterized protein n=1 Tax=Taenia crassiceps TaxID=6207 RepID=A0ABR4QQ37_9CEST
MCLGEPDPSSLVGFALLAYTSNELNIFISNRSCILLGLQLVMRNNNWKRTGLCVAEEVICGLAPYLENIIGVITQPARDIHSISALDTSHRSQDAMCMAGEPFDQITETAVPVQPTTTTTLP